MTLLAPTRSRMFAYPFNRVLYVITSRAPMARISSRKKKVQRDSARRTCSERLTVRDKQTDRKRQVFWSLVPWSFAVQPAASSGTQAVCLLNIFPVLLNPLSPLARTRLPLSECTSAPCMQYPFAFNDKNLLPLAERAPSTENGTELTQLELSSQTRLLNIAHIDMRLVEATALNPNPLLIRHVATNCEHVMAPTTSQSRTSLCPYEQEQPHRDRMIEWPAKHVEAPMGPEPTVDTTSA